MFKRIISRAVIGSVCLVVLIAGYAISAGPGILNYQGRLRESGQPVSGTKSIEFTIHSAPVASAEVWSSDPQTITISTGIFSYALGKDDPDDNERYITDIDWGDGNEYWMEIVVEGIALSPREQLVASAYSFYSDDSDLLDGRDYLFFVTTDTTNQVIGGIKTFTAIPVLPASDPTTDNQAARKAYVDAQVGSSGILASTNTWTGQNTFQNQVTISSGATILGNVGIGTTSPTRKLDIAGNIYFTTVESDGLRTAWDASANGGQHVIYGEWANHTVIKSFSNKNIDLWPEGTGNVLIRSGNVGIGTTSPNTRFVVQNGSITITGTNANLIVGGIISGDGSGITNVSADSVSSAGDVIITADSDSNDTGAVILRSGSTDVVYVSTAGNVGIGTTNPGAKLEVDGIGEDLLQLSRDGSRKAWVTEWGGVNTVAGFDSTDGTISDPGFGFIDDGNTGIYRGGEDILHLVTGGAERISMIANGNVGIGTTSPTHKLRVEGGILATSSITANAGFYGDGSNLSGIVTNPMTSKLNLDASGADLGTTSGAGIEIDTAVFITAGKLEIRGVGGLGAISVGPNEVLPAEGTVLIAPTFNTDNYDMGDVLWVAGMTYRMYVNKGIRTDGDIYIDNGNLLVRDGNAGIGDISPDAQLDIKSNSSPGGYILSISSQSDVTGDIFSILGNGNVGIGTTSPTHKLRVEGGILATSSITANAGVFITAGKLEIRGVGGLGAISVGPNEVLPVEGNVLIAPALNIDNFNITDIGWFIGATYRMYVNKGIRTDGDIYIDNGNLLVRDGNAGIGDISPDAQLDIKSNSSPSGYILSISSQSDVTGDIFSILGNGNVGIGTTNPGYPLDVSGNVRITGVTATGVAPTLNTSYGISNRNGWPTSTITRAFNNDFYYNGTSGIYGIYNRVFPYGVTSSASYGIYNYLQPSSNLTGDAIALYSHVTTAGTGDDEISGQFKGGYVVIGDIPASPGIVEKTAGDGDLYIEDELEVSGASYFAGNVGIGMSEPTEKLELYGTISIRQNQFNSGGKIVPVGNSLSISISGVECIRFDYIRNVGIGDTTPDAHLEVSANGSTGGNAFLVSSNDDTDGDLLTVLENGRVGIGTTSPDYQLELSLNSAGKPTSNTWTIVSDRRLKKDIKPFTDGLDVITRINPVSYKLNGKAGTPKDAEGISVIAQDIKDVAPYTISTYKAKLELEDKEDTELYDFDSSPLTFVMINAIKELKEENEELKKRIEALESN